MSLSKTIPIAAAFCCLTFMAAPVAADEFRRISNEAEFQDRVVGRKLVLDDNYAVFRKNGKVTGNFRGEKLQGVWQWRDGYWCRTLKTHSKNTDCQLMEIAGNKLRGTRNRGKGNSFVYTIK